MTAASVRVHARAIMAEQFEETRWRGEAAVSLRRGDLAATFLPDLGMTGVSVVHRGEERLAVPGGVDAIRSGATAGMPILAPWANRLGAWRYRAAGVDVDLAGTTLRTDENGLPIHGLLVGRPGWIVHDRTGGRRVALEASLDVDSPAFPFRHRIRMEVTVQDSLLIVDTTIVPTGPDPVPIAFGWHPYLRLTDGQRSEWQLRLPERRHLALDARGIPTGTEAPEAEEEASIDGRTFDDLYSLGDDARLAVRSPAGRSIELRAGAGYPFAQVWVPAGEEFLALEPMTAPTDALGSGDAPLVEPGGEFTARFELGFT